MKVYTIREAARETKIGMEPLKRACEERLIHATKLSGGQWRIAESALAEALHNGIDFAALPTKKPAQRRPQPEALRKAQEARQKAKTKASIDTKLAAAATKPTTKTTAKATTKTKPAGKK